MESARIFCAAVSRQVPILAHFRVRVNRSSRAYPIAGAYSLYIVNNLTFWCIRILSADIPKQCLMPIVRTLDMIICARWFSLISETRSFDAEEKREHMVYLPNTSDQTSVSRT